MAPVSSMGGGVAVSADVAGIDLVVPLSRHVSGTVTWGAGSATSGAVRFFDLYGNLAAETSIAAGVFTASVRPGKYLLAADGTTGFATAWYGPSGFAISSANATIVTVAAADVSGIGIVLPATVTVSGTIRNPSGTGLDSVDAEAWIDGV